MKEKVYEYLNNMNISFDIYNHPALYTCEDNNKYELVFDGIICKNLFLRNKNKSKYYLISMPAEKNFSLDNLALELSEKKLSFANEEELSNKLKIRSGAVSLLNFVEAGDTDVVLILDESLVNESKIGFHPNDNTATIFFSGNVLENLLKN